MKRTKWFDRSFASISDNGLMPGIIERLAGTPARVEEKIQLLDGSELADNEAGWSFKKEVGHLIDLEPLWLNRMKQIADAQKDLIAADLTNRKTHETDHDAEAMVDLAASFRKERKKLMDFLSTLEDEDLEKAANHPRLGTPMRVIDLAFFVAEHDDHHLAQMTIIGSLQKRKK